MSAFISRNWKVITVGLAMGGMVEALLIKGGFYDQMRSARAQHLDTDWAAMTEQEKIEVLKLEERYRQIKAKKEHD